MKSVYTMQRDTVPVAKTSHQLTVLSQPARQLNTESHT